MKMIKSVFMAAVVTLVLGMWHPPAMAAGETKKIDDAVNVLKKISANPKKGIPPALLANATGIAIFPALSKTDFMASNRHGSGFMLRHDGDGNWSNPVFLGISGGTIGWQIVAEKMDIILIFRDRKYSDAVMKGKYTLGSKVMVIAGPVGHDLKGATEEELKAAINSYVRSNGEFKQISLTGTSLQIEDAANEAFYGKKEISARDILSGKVGKSSAEVGNLKKLLIDYSNEKKRRE